MRKIVFLAMMLAGIIGCGSNKEEKTTLEKRIKVNTAAVAHAQSEYNLGYSGSVEASQTIPLTFKTNGTVEKIFVEVGDMVKQGQLLASIDKSDVLNIYNSMLAKYQQAKDAYDRLKTVYDNGSLPEIKWVEMKSNYEQAKSMLDLSGNNLESCNMVAPTDGIIGSRNIEPGQSTLGLSAPFKLVKIENVSIKISVPENEISKIIKGQEASISVSALDEKKFRGIVTNISPVADALSRTYTAKISVKNNNLELKPGMVCDVTLNFSTEKLSLVVPYKAVSKDSEGKNYVYVVSSDNKKVKKQIIKVGQYNDSGIEVINGLTEGQTVVCEGCEKLSDNSLISL
jgi:membrane fusion protein, multidrug efflux system